MAAPVHPVSPSGGGTAPSLPWPEACTQLLVNEGYTEPEKLGDGGYSVVYKFKSSKTKNRTEVAIKFIDMEKTPANYRNKYMPREMEAMKTLKHANIVRVLQIVNDGSISPDKMPHRFWIVMELCATDLFYATAKYPKHMVPETKGRIWMSNVAEGLKFMKEKGWAHRDVKPENILIRADDTAALTDFSFSRTQEKGKLSATPICTSGYAAPEVLKVMEGYASNYDAFQADVWSLASVMFLIHTGSPIVSHKLTDQSVLLEDQKKIPDRIKSSHVSDLLKDLMTKMTVVDFSKRFTIEHALEHKWFSVPEDALKPKPEKSQEAADSRSRSKSKTSERPKRSEKSDHTERSSAKHTTAPQTPAAAAPPAPPAAPEVSQTPVPWPVACTQMLANSGYTDPVKLGEGGYSVVYKFKSSMTKNRPEVAIKFIDMDKTSSTYRMTFMPRELEALKTLKHKHIVRIMQGLSDATLHQDNFPHRYWIVMELCATDLFDVAAKFPKFSIPESTGRTWISQVGEALKFMKEKGWAHRDIKPENILIRTDDTAALTDFSFVRIQLEGHLSTTPICTPVYAAPEVLKVMSRQLHAYDAFQADVWSLACVIFVAHSGGGMVSHKLEDGNLILKDQNKVPERIKGLRVSAHLKDLMTKMTDVIPTKRLTVEQMLQHKWFSVPVEELKPTTEATEVPDATRTRVQTSEKGRLRSQKLAPTSGPQTPATPAKKSAAKHKTPDPSTPTPGSSHVPTTPVATATTTTAKAATPATAEKRVIRETSKGHEEKKDASEQKKKKTA